MRTPGKAIRPSNSSTPKQSMTIMVQLHDLSVSDYYSRCSATTVTAAFAFSCAKGGSSLCPPCDSGLATNIVSAIHTLIDQLYYSPLPVIQSLDTPALTVTADIARYLLFQTAYTPAAWPASAAAFAEAIAGNGTLLALYGSPTLGTSLIDAASQSATYPFVLHAVMCDDWRPYDKNRPPPSVSEFARLVSHSLSKGSRAMGKSLYWHEWCDQWPLESRSRYAGSLKLKADTLKTPILIFTNSYDPITSKQGALVAQKNLGTTNTRLIEQNGTCHTTLSMSSACIQQTVSTLSSRFYED